MEHGKDTSKNVDVAWTHVKSAGKHGTITTRKGELYMQEIIVRQSELKRWTRCRRASYLQYTEGWSKPSEDSDVRGVGTHFHGLMAEYYGDVEPDENIKYNPDDVQTSQVMFDTYVSEMEETGMDAGQETVFVEERMFTAPIQVAGDTFYRVSCQVDHLYRDTAIVGEPLVGQDHKTSASFFNTADNDFQLMVYAVVLHDNGYPVEYMEHNIVKRNKRTGRAKPPYTQRNRIRITSEALDWWAGYLHTMCHEHYKAHEISTSVRSPQLYPVPDNTCSWGCDFVDVCGMVDEGEDYESVLINEYQKEGAFGG
tara:strand:+ start:2934 stop:3866 length:933 start_codon:yes stop_codon:yes gene_type:complete